jgi:hypothetical protein
MYYRVWGLMDWVFAVAGERSQAGKLLEKHSDKGDQQGEIRAGCGYNSDVLNCLSRVQAEVFRLMGLMMSE